MDDDYDEALYLERKADWIAFFRAADVVAQRGSLEEYHGFCNAMEDYLSED